MRKIIISFIFLFILINMSYADLLVNNQTTVGETIYVFITDFDQNGTLLNTTISVTTPSKTRFNVDIINGQAEFEATETGNWIIDYYGIEKIVQVGNNNIQKQNGINEDPYLIYLIIIILGIIICGTAILFVLHSTITPSFEFIKKYTNNQVILIFTNNTEKEIDNVIIEDTIPEKISGLSMKPEHETKDKIIWKLKNIGPHERKIIKYCAKLDRNYPATVTFEHSKKTIKINSFDDADQNAMKSKDDNKPKQRKIRKLKKSS